MPRKDRTMTNLAQHIQTLQLRLYEEELEDLLVTLKEIEALTTEHSTKETYDLLAHAYRAICDATSDDPDSARYLVLQRLLPWLIKLDLPESADYARSDGRDILKNW